MASAETARKPSPAPRSQTLDDEDAPADKPVQSGKARWTRGRRIVTAALTALLVAVAVLTWKLATAPEPAGVQPTVAENGRYAPGSLPSETGAAAVRAATDKVPGILSYDYRTLDENLRAATATMTSAFAKTFTQTFHKVVEPMATKNRAVTRALVRGGGLASLSDDDTKAVCVLFVDQLLVTSNGKRAVQPHIGKERVRVTLSRADGRWRINDIEPF